MLASIFSGNCNVVAPVAEDLKIIDIMWDCGTEKILEGVMVTESNGSLLGDIPDQNLTLERGALQAGPSATHRVADA